MHVLFLKHVQNLQNLVNSIVSWIKSIIRSHFLKREQKKRRELKFKESQMYPSWDMCVLKAITSFSVNLDSFCFKDWGKKIDEELGWKFIQSQDGEFLKQEQLTCTNVTLSFQEKKVDHFLYFNSIFISF